MEKISIAIDGPAGAGKSTIAKKIAKKLGIIYVDTGAMYRAFGLYCIKNNINPNDINNLKNIINDVKITIKYIEGEQQVLLNNENVNNQIRTEEVGDMASAISVCKEVRLKLVEMQRELALVESVIMDGRDIGTYVLPNASLKVYLTASVDIRAKRRWNEYKEKGIEKDFNILKEEIEQRDYRDMNREFAPLKKADDATVLDTTNLNIDGVVDEIIKLL
jgi:cytidylate kinase